MTVSYLLVLILLARNVYSSDMAIRLTPVEQLFLQGYITAKLTGDQEVPPVVTQVQGKANFAFNQELTEMAYELKAQSSRDEPVGLLGQAGAHIHCGAVGKNGPIVAFLSGVITGGVDGMVEIKATLTDANIVANTCMNSIQQDIKTLKDLAEAMHAGNTYVNIHSNAHPGGEVRGQIVTGN
ncbi:CHRD domain-containing protein [Nitrosomonas sp. Is37]|nr:CHRD domain-containing protein [Nitrosomonas sp. Is37]MDV6343330.1 CHRD domain-containing protein [Nitrosomonas sp. Is37]